MCGGWCHHMDLYLVSQLLCLHNIIRACHFSYSSCPKVRDRHTRAQIHTHLYINRRSALIVDEVEHIHEWAWSRHFTSVILQFGPFGLWRIPAQKSTAGCTPLSYRQLCTHVLMYLRTCVCTYTYTYTHVHTHTHIHTHTNRHAHAHTHHCCKSTQTHTNTFLSTDYSLHTLVSLLLSVLHFLVVHCAQEAQGLAINLSLEEG